LQTLIDCAGDACTTLRLKLVELADAGIEEVAIVIAADVDDGLYRAAAGETPVALHFVRQPPEQRGFGRAILCAREFTGDDSFLLMVSDHAYVSDDAERSCARQLIEAAASEACVVSAVQPTHESHLAHFGVIGGKISDGRPGVYEVNRVWEKPTPTDAEQELMIPGQRIGYYLCFFGMHILTPGVMSTLAEELESGGAGSILGLSPALDATARRGKYLACQVKGRRFNLEDRYGLMKAELALGLLGSHREELLAEIIELLAAMRSS